MNTLTFLSFALFIFLFRIFRFKEYLIFEFLVDIPRTFWINRIIKLSESEKNMFPSVSEREYPTYPIFIQVAQQHPK